MGGLAVVDKKLRKGCASIAMTVPITNKLPEV